jgi:cyclic dehypoxanthinyl futalosine synthase
LISQAPEIGGAVDAALAGRRLGMDDALALFEGADLLTLGMLADAARNRLVPSDEVTYAIDRNINYTNVCVTRCSFCAFYVLPGAEGRYVLPFETIGEKIAEAQALGATHILLQGGHNPELGIDYYERLFRFMTDECGIWVHGLSPSEIDYCARISGLSLEATLGRMRDAGLRSIPGGGAEILTDRVRDVISPLKLSADGWLGVMRMAHRMGIRSTATMMFGSVDDRRDRIEHLLRIRDLQDETGGFCAFIPWTYQPGRAPLEAEEATAVEYLRTLSVCRLVLDNIGPLQSSWVTQGTKVAQVALAFGATDIGSTMMEENVVSASGRTPSRFDSTLGGMRRLIRDAGYRPVQRDAIHRRVEPSTNSEHP